MTTLQQLPGVEFRQFAGPSDYPHLARLLNAAARAEGNDRVETAESFAAYYEHLERCDPKRDLLVAEVDGEPVAYSRVWWDEEAGGPHLYRLVSFVDPASVGTGVDSALHAWCEARLREIAADHDAAERLFESWINDRNEAGTALVRGAGYEPVTYSAEMVRPSVDDLPDHALPEDLEIRPVREEEIRTIWEAEVESFRDHWGFVEPTEESYAGFLAFPHMDTTLWKIAWDDEGVAGQVKSFVDLAQNEEIGRQRGWTESIATSRRWRRRGVAKALIVESIRELKSRGITEVALAVHTENPNGAFDLYSGLGYEVVASWTTYRKALAVRKPGIR